jgi:peptidoglycan hydrolase-like protein with peptidoglycan-binding domain
MLRPGPERIEEIQQALVKSGYLSAQPNGHWDDQTREAMRRYQADNGFPVTGLPEAKSLMKLGLGPHPLPPDLDTSNVAKAGANGNAAATPNAPAESPTPNPQPSSPPPASPQP